jgi:hypothetical protein
MSIKLNYNLKDVPDAAVFDGPPGRYNAFVLKASVEKSKQDTRVLRVELEISDGDWQGSRLFDFIPLDSEAAGWRLKAFLRGLLGRVPEGDEVPDPAEYEGKPVIIYVADSLDQNGQPRKRIRRYEQALVKKTTETPKQSDEVDF